MSLVLVQLLSFNKKNKVVLIESDAVSLDWTDYLNLPSQTYMMSLVQDGAEYGRRVASSGNTLQFFVCFISFFVVLHVRCC